jgi:2'-5' RNA ligase
MSEAIRAFLAVEPSPEIHRKLVDLKTLLASTGAAVRWVRNDGLHTTVKFLGPVAPDALGHLRDALGSIRLRCSPFTVEARGLGVFPNLRRPRILWIGMHSGHLAELSIMVEKAAAMAGFAPESRPFQPHITLGRVKSMRGWPRLARILKSHWDSDLGSCQMRELIAFRSDLHPDGAVYTKLWTIDFGNRIQGEPNGTGC